MSKAPLIDMARRNIAHVKAGTVDQARDVYRVPAAHYFDPERWQLEMEQIFRRLPLVLGFTAELREPGAYKALEVAGVPVLITRGADGEVRGFVNMCSHRGAIVVEEGVGTAPRFVCPYHAWVYDQRGELVGISNQKTFGEVDRSRLGLTPLPVAERAGLIFVGLTPGAALDIDAFLCGYDQVLAHLGLEKCHVVGRQSLEGPNWKVAYDGYLDFYHLPVLHRNSFGPRMPSHALYDAWGPHQRVTAPNPRFLKLEALPEEEWDVEGLTGGVWTIFPHVSIADFDAGGKLYMVSQLFPGRSADESLTIQNFLATSEPDDSRQGQIAETMKFLEHVVANEDYYTGLRIQRAVKTGAKKEFLFGRNEAGGQRFHLWVEAFVQAKEADLPALFADGVEAP
jgi:nitrite reductase/ring-hydroxylating ferredoxin subunit